MPDRALRLLWEHAFSVAGWRTDPADVAVDALAAAFNAEADAVVVAQTDPASTAVGRETLAELVRDEELRDVPRYAIVIGDGAGEELAGVRVFQTPCDPFWLICEADAALGRETPRGLGRRPFTDSDTDIMVHAWWWAIAAADLVQRVVKLKAEGANGDELARQAVELLEKRVDVAIETGKSGSFTSAGATMELTPMLSWRVLAPAEGLSRGARECVAVVAKTLHNMLN